MSAFARWAPAAAWAAAIFILSHQPLEVPPQVGRFDWLAHFLVFGLLAALLCWAVSDGGRRRISPAAVIAIWAACVLYGALDEWHQSFVPNRHPSGADVAADAVGALAFAVAASWVLVRRLPPR